MFNTILLMSILMAAFGIIKLNAIDPFIALNTSSVKHLDWVRVTFGGIPLPSSAGAWLGIFSPSNSSLNYKKYTSAYSSPPWTENAPLKYVLCSNITNCLENGESFVDLCLENTFEVKIFMIFYRLIVNNHNVERT